MNYIYKINAADGKVVQMYDLSGLVGKVQGEDPHANVLNGIAYNAKSGKLLITGKNWAHFYEINTGSQ